MRARENAELPHSLSCVLQVDTFVDNENSRNREVHLSDTEEPRCTKSSTLIAKTLPKRFRPITATEDPTRAQLRRLSVDPRCKQSSTLREKTDPNRPIPTCMFFYLVYNF